jgi:hypothetical protein
VLCPRCDKDEGIKFFEAPRDKSWELYRCQRCNFVWRNTEKEEIRNKDLYPPHFKLSDDKISRMLDKPVIPPLKKRETS